MNKKKFCVHKKDQPQDPKWYLENDASARDAAQLGFTNATGESLNNDLGKEVNTVPGIMAIYFAPSIGRYYSLSTAAGWASSALNLATSKQYANMRRKNTASPVYQKTDLAVYNICLDSLISYHAYLARIYKIINYFKNRNKYTAIDLLQTMGVDYYSVSTNLASFRIYINNYAKKINNALSVPNLTVFTRHYWLNSHVWRDGDTEKAQLYLYNQYAFHKYNPTKSSDGGGTDALNLFTASGPLLSVNDLKLFGDNLISALISDDDILLISADVDKWYGGNQYFLPTIAEGDSIEPEYSLEVLAQLQNTTLFKAVRLGDIYQHATGLYISQDFGLQTIVGDNKSTEEYYTKKLLVSPYDKPSPEEILVMTRNMARVKQFTNAIINDATLGSEVFMGMEILTNPRLFAGVAPDVTTGLMGLTYNFNDDDINTLAFAISNMASFDMAPGFLLYDTTSGAEQAAYIGLEYDNYTHIDFERLDQIHTMALFSEFGFYQTQFSGDRG